MVEKEYEKKDITAAPKVKSKIPEGWQLYLKRGVWCVRNEAGTLSKHASKKDSMYFINGE